MAIKNRKLRLPESGEEFYEVDEKNLDSDSEKIAHTDQFRLVYIYILTLLIHFHFSHYKYVYIYIYLPAGVLTKQQFFRMVEWHQHGKSVQ